MTVALDSFLEKGSVSQHDVLKLLHEHTVAEYKLFSGFAMPARTTMLLLLFRIKYCQLDSASSC